MKKFCVANYFIIFILLLFVALSYQEEENFKNLNLAQIKQRLASKVSDHQLIKEAFDVMRMVSVHYMSEKDFIELMNRISNRKRNGRNTAIYK